MELTCHNCGNVINVDEAPQQYICKVCGAINVVEIKCRRNWMHPPTSFEWVLPAGVMVDAIGRKTYVTADGRYMTKDRYMDEFGFDPDIALENMRKHKGVHKA